ncbi:MAG: M13 family peptidase, partial [Allosphingosinicella sp.]
MRSRFLLLAASTALAACAATTEQTESPPAAQSRPQPQFGAFGFDLAGMDRSVDPGDNFYRFANGHWDDITQIPADRSNYGMFTLLDDLSKERTRTILDEAAPNSRIGAFYASYMDEAAVNAAGLTPIRPLLSEIQSIASREQLAGEMGQLMRQGVSGPFGGYVATDDRIPTDMIVRLTQSGLGLPDRDYYLRDDPSLVEKRNAYRAYLAQLLTLVGEANASERATAVLAFETQIANAHWTRVESRDDEKTYNKRSLAELQAQAPGFDWGSFFQSVGIADQANVLVSQPSAFTGSARVLSQAPLPVLKDYLLLRTIDAYAPYLSSQFVDAN